MVDLPTGVLQTKAQQEPVVANLCCSGHMRPLGWHMSQVTPAQNRSSSQVSDALEEFETPLMAIALPDEHVHPELLACMLVWELSKPSTHA